MSDYIQAEIRLDNAQICDLAIKGLRSQGVPVADGGVVLDCGDDSLMDHGREILVIATLSSESGSRKPRVEEFRQDRLHVVVLEALQLGHLDPSALRFYHDPTRGVSARVDRPNMA